ncbi:DUF1615 family protein [Aestuariivirga litoralis]|uniref:DUF1615 family protein n=1 Tax=Aestuariivirga litoralis TaxID=2650924 RepID=UPI0018C67BB7|nr:DUF1615 family protein [Aestuariivirga litoralis]
MMAFLVFSGLGGTALAADLTPGEAYILIKHARPGVTDPDGWAADLIDVLKAQSIPANRENVCAVIAVIDQESNFIANPTVPGLGRLAEKSLREKFGHVPFLSTYVMDWLDSHPAGGTSYLQRIRIAKTEQDLDLTYRALVNDFGTASNMSFVVQSGLLNRAIEERNNISTVGSMQVSVHFALDEARKRRYLPMTLSDVYAVRDELYTRRGGMYYGVRQLLGYETGYNRKIFRFADFNAGRYSSRNASFQHIIATLAKQKLARDGDLLIYDKNGTAQAAVSSSESALRSLSSTNALGLSDKLIRSDLLQEKDDAFALTQTFIAVKGLYLRQTGQPAPYAELPGIDLASPKLSHKMTTASYATSVDRRYAKCAAARL